MSPSPDPNTSESPRDPFFRRVLAGLALGILTGLFLGEAVWPISIASDAFIKLLQVTVLPYVLGSVIVGIGDRSTDDAKLLARRGGLLLLLVWAAVLLWVVASSLAYPALGSHGMFAGDVPPAAPINWVDLYVPANVFHSLANNILPAVVLFAILAGVAISGMPPELKRPLLEVLEAFNEAMRRVSRFIIRLTPIGLFTMAAAAAGTLQVDDFLRLQIWFVVYIGSACLLALWLLPSLVPLVTPIPYRRFVGSLQTALLTAFAAGDYFVVLPMIVEANRKLLEEQGVSSQDADRTIGVAVPLLFNFPHAGKILTLAFFPFAAWFSGTDLGANQWLTLTTAGVLSLFGNINAAVPFLLDLLQLPADLFNLFTMSSVLNVRFGALVAAMHTAVLSMLVAASLLGRTRLHPGRLVRTGVLAAAVLAAFVLGTRLLFGDVIPPAPTGIAALEGFRLRPGQPPAVVRPRAAALVSPGPAGDRLAIVLERGTLRVGFFGDGVPYTFYNPEQALVGYDVEMANGLASGMGVTPEFVPIGHDELAPALDSGACDIVMSGVAVTTQAAEIVDFSTSYHEERFGLLVADHRREEFASAALLLNRPLAIGAPSERIAVPARRLLPNARVSLFPVQRLLESGSIDDLDALVLPMDQAYYVSRVQPAFTAVAPEGSNVRAVMAYALPRGATALRDVVNTWVSVTDAGGGFADAYEYWVRGKAQMPHVPRWSIGHDMLRWW
jgi:Na+/H+-dicarboxylate symporter/ABC-type amino acid transport substrate-binding protein